MREKFRIIEGGKEEEIRELKPENLLQKVRDKNPDIESEDRVLLMAKNRRRALIFNILRNDFNSVNEEDYLNSFDMDDLSEEDLSCVQYLMKDSFELLAGLVDNEIDFLFFDSDRSIRKDAKK